MLNSTKQKAHIPFAFLAVIMAFTTFMANANKYIQQTLEENRPDNYSDKKWLSLKTALRETKLYPTPVTPGGYQGVYGSSISLDGDRVLIGSPGNFFNHGIAYILDFDGNSWQQTAFFQPPDTNIDDKFGVSVSLLGNRALIGARGDNDNGSNSGAAYIYELINGVWTQRTKLKAMDSVSQSYFGHSVSLANDRALIGAYNNATGSAYIFDFLTEDIWLETKKIIPADGINGGLFGYSVSLSGDRALIGAYRDNDNGTDSGSAYIYELILDNWVFRSKLESVAVTAGDQFGISVSLSGDRALIGAHKDSQNGTNSGSAYIFDLILGNWVETKLIASDGIGGDFFGKSVSLLGDVALIGSPFADVSNTGLAYVFNLIGNTWIETKVIPNQTASTNGIGMAVSLSSDRIFIGAQNDETQGLQSGAAYVFDFIGNNWMQTEKTLPNDSAANDDFGYSVSLGDNRALIGAPQDNENGSAHSGSAYIFDYIDSQWQLAKKITANDSAQFDGFGNAVFLNGDLALIGASSADDYTGSVYVFNLAANGWQQSQKLTAFDGSTDDRFGGAVSILRTFGGTWAVVGANGNNLNTGAVYTFAFNSATDQWEDDSKLVAANSATNDFFGTSISSSGTRVLIGASGDDDAGTNAGAAYVFKLSLSVGGWTQEDKITADDASDGDLFGASVSLSGLTGLIGAPGYDGLVSFDIGTAYIVKNVANNWLQTDRLTINGGTGGILDPRFGSAVCLVGNRAVINASGINTAYIFKLSNNAWSNTDQFSANRNKPVSLFGDKILVGLEDSTIAPQAGAARIIDLNILFNDGFE